MLLTKARFSDEVSKRELEHFNLSKQIAHEAIVLLENDGVLPLKNKNIALYGMGAALTVKGGTGSGEVNERSVVSILDGLKNNGFNITSMNWINEYLENYHKLRSEYLELKRKKFNLLKVSMS